MKDIIDEVNRYYTEKVQTYGATPRGVDWNGTESQELRFAQLLKMADRDSSFSLLDYGCGFGSLYAYLQKDHVAPAYTGYDISEEMLSKARELFPGQGTWLNRIPEGFTADYVVASGLFNVKQDQPAGTWEAYMLETLDHMNAIAQKGFSFNVLTSYSDKEFMKDYLYYASPEKLFAHCKTKYSKQVALLHDYPLYEFTLIVRK